MEISVPARGSARTIVREMIKHLCSSISYGGAASPRELREKFWADPDRYLIKLSSSSRRGTYRRAASGVGGGELFSRGLAPGAPQPTTPAAPPDPVPPPP